MSVTLYLVLKTSEGFVGSEKHWIFMIFYKLIYLAVSACKSHPTLAWHATSKSKVGTKVRVKVKGQMLFFAQGMSTCIRSI